MLTPTVVTAPTKEPVSLAEVKGQLRLDMASTAEDTDLNRFIAAARWYYEWRTGRTIHQTTYDWVLSAFPGESYIALPRATPLVSITSLIYKDSTGASTTVANTEYIADTDSTPGRLVLGYNKSWPSFTPYPVSPVKVRYVAGIATASPLVEADDDIKLPILLLIGGFYENRESIVLGPNSMQQISIQYGVEHYLAKRQVDYEF